MNLDEKLAAGKSIDVVIVEIGKAGSLDATTLIESVTKMLYILQKVPAMTAVTFCLGGFDDDERAICEIPEARQFVIKFAEMLDDAGVPPDRFLDDAVALVVSCMAADAGKTVIFDEIETKSADLVKGYRAKVRQSMH